jgi:hypothetical protein
MPNKEKSEVIFKNNSMKIISDRVKYYLYYNKNRFSGNSEKNKLLWIGNP